MFHLSFTDDVIKDISSARRYIRKKLESPMASKKLALELDETYSKLEENPYRRPLVQDKYLAMKGYRSINVKNYVLFYMINEEENIVSLVRFMHSQRDWATILANEFD